MTAAKVRPRVWFVKAIPGHAEVARWIVHYGTSKYSSPSIGYVVARRGVGTQTVAYWYGYTLDGHELAASVLYRAEAADAVALHHLQQPRP